MAKKINHSLHIHGYEIVDPYHWMRDRKDPDLITLLEQENQKTNKALEHTQDLQKNIYEEIISRIREDDQSYPYQMGSYKYFSKIEKGQNYRSYWRTKKDQDSPQILVDLNIEKKQHPFFHVASTEVSPSEKLIAYSYDVDGSENYHIVVKEIETGKIVDQSLKKTDGSIEWGFDDQCLYYATLDETMRPYRVYCHQISQSQDQDSLIYEDTDLSYYVHLGKSNSKRFLIVESESKLTSEVHTLDLAGDQTLRCIQKRIHGLEYHVEHHGNYWMILCNQDAENFKIMKAPLEQSNQEHWEDFIPHQIDRSISDFDVFSTHLVISERYRGLSHFRIVEMETKKIHELHFEEEAYVISDEINPEFTQNFFRFTYSSPLQENILYTYDFESGALKILQEKITPQLNKENYIIERLFAPSHDGKDIPITLIRKKNHDMGSPSPLFLMGYGSYGICSEPRFSPSIFSLLDRGFMVATAHIRGGGECGRPWHYDGRFFTKKNSFLDFISCAEFLISKGYTKKKSIAIRGGSAGGLLMGAVSNMKPELWGAVLALVPFVDVINTMTDESLPLTITEYEEWGNPQKKEYFDYMYSYSPYENIEEKNYPPILATGGLNDPRVAYWEPTKWVLALREKQRDQSNPILLKMEMEAGHQGPSGRYAAYQEVALHYAFAIDQIASKQKSS
ncbi:MAG: S9 family peptidase [Bdellovibrionales bacterium]|nr:S9 family peptidase [Bdellovibrionales bacterium]